LKICHLATLPPWAPSTLTRSQLLHISNRHSNEFMGSPGLPDFSCYKIPKRGKMYQTTTKYA
jgi:hypothetical protein